MNELPSSLGALLLIPSIPHIQAPEIFGGQKSAKGACPCGARTSPVDALLKYWETCRCPGTYAQRAWRGEGLQGLKRERPTRPEALNTQCLKCTYRQSPSILEMHLQGLEGPAGAGSFCRLFASKILLGLEMLDRRFKQEWP